MPSTDPGSSLVSVNDSSSDSLPIHSSDERGSNEVSCPNVSTGDIIIALIGQTGTGKTLFANKVAGTHGIGVGHSLVSSTDQITIFRYTSPGGFNVVLIDTPGFNDTSISDYEILRRIADWLYATYQRSITLSGVLYFHRISDNRMTGTERQNIGIFRSLVGDGALVNVIIISTMWDELKEEAGMEAEELLKNGYWKEMISKKARVMRHDNTTESAHNIVSMLLNTTNTALLVQEEMVKHGKALPETSVGRKFATWVTDLRKIARKTVFKLEKKERNEGVSEALREKIAEQKRIEKEAEEFEQGLATRFRRWIGMGPTPAPERVPVRGTESEKTSLPQQPALVRLKNTMAPRMGQKTSTSSNTSTIPSPIHSLSRSEIPTHSLKCLEWVKNLEKNGLLDCLDDLVNVGIKITKCVKTHWSEERAFGYPLVHLTWFVLAIYNHMQGDGDYWCGEDGTDPTIRSCVIEFYGDFMSIRTLIEDQMKRPPQKKLREHRPVISICNENTSATCLRLASHIEADIRTLHLELFKKDAAVRSLHERVTQALLPVKHDKSYPATKQASNPLDYEVLIDMFLAHQEGLLNAVQQGFINASQQGRLVQEQISTRPAQSIISNSIINSSDISVNIFKQYNNTRSTQDRGSSRRNAGRRATEPQLKPNKSQNLVASTDEVQYTFVEND